MFGIGNLFDPLKQAGTSLFGGPKPPSGAAGWGQIPPPGSPPGILDQPPGGLLRAGDDDMQPPPTPGGTGGMPLLKAGLEGGPMGGARGGPLQGSAGADTLAGGDRNMAEMPAIGAQSSQYIIPSTGQAVPAGTTTPMPGGGPSSPAGSGRTPERLTPVGQDIAQGPTTLTGRVPEATTPMTGITSPSTSPQYTPTPPQPGESSAPLQNPYQAAPPAAAPAAAPAAVPANAPGGGNAPGTGAAGGGGLDKLGDIGKAISQGGAGGQKGNPPSHAPSHVGAAHTPEGAGLMAKILEGQQARMPQIGPVPGLPPGLLERYKR